MYEVKVSWPATHPVDVDLELVSVDSASLSATRRLLNSEKLIFSTPAADELLSFHKYSRIIFTPKWHGITWNAELSNQTPPLVFNIEVERLLVGLPLQCLQHVACVLLAIGFIVVAALRKPAWWPASMLLDTGASSSYDKSRRAKSRLSSKSCVGF